jgi:hypothetical protein
VGVEGRELRESVSVMSCAYVRSVLVFADPTPNSRRCPGYSLLMSFVLGCCTALASSY